MGGFAFDREEFGHSLTNEGEYSAPPNRKPCYACTMFQKILRVDHEICCVNLYQIDLIIQNVHNQLKKYIANIYELFQSNSFRV